LGGAATLAGCIITDGDPGVTCVESDGESPARRSLFVGNLVPTTAVKTPDGPDIWQPRQVNSEGTASMYSWEVPAFSELDEDTAQPRVEIPAEVHISGAAPSEELPETVISGTKDVTTGIEGPGCRGRYDRPLAADLAAGEEFGDIYAPSLGTLNVAARLPEDSVFAAPGADLRRTAEGPTAPLVPRADDYAFQEGYSIVNTTADLYSDALEQGYRDLKRLMAFTQLLFGAGVATLAPASVSLLSQVRPDDVALQFLYNVAKRRIKSELKGLAVDAAKVGLMEVFRAIDGEGNRVDPVGPNATDARMVEGVVFVPPTTDEQRSAFDKPEISTSAYGVPGHQIDDEGVEFGIGLSGPFVSFREPGPEEQTATPAGLSRATTTAPTRTPTPEDATAGTAATTTTPGEQRIVLDLDPTASFKRVPEDDTGVPAPDPVVLADHGIRPGDELTPRTTGTYVIGPSGNERCAVIGVFSRTDEILGPRERDRVPGALDAGADYETVDTYPAGEPTDIPEDFLISGSPDDIDGCERRRTTVTVPEGAAYLFVAVEDDRYNDNSGEISVEITWG
jgi:hypothetical protein